MKKGSHKLHGIVLCSLWLLSGCGMKEDVESRVELQPVMEDKTEIEVVIDTGSSSIALGEEVPVVSGNEDKETIDDSISDNSIEEISVEEVFLDEEMQYAENSKIHTEPALLYRNPDHDKGAIVICVNAGHGTNGGTQVKTLCHPDGTPKVTGGSTVAGSVTATAVSSGMAFPDGTPEKEVTLQQALILKELLLASGYSVLMIREGEDIQLDNIARTVLANEYADCHIALHWDSSENDKGAFYCSVPDIESYRKMEPVASTWEMSHTLGDCVIEGLRAEGVKIYGSGAVPIDLTQTSYSGIASIDLELGDKGSDRSEEQLYRNAQGILKGIDLYFERE